MDVNCTFDVFLALTLRSSCPPPALSVTVFYYAFNCFLLSAAMTLGWLAATRHNPLAWREDKLKRTPRQLPVLQLPVVILPMPPLIDQGEEASDEPPVPYFEL